MSDDFLGFPEWIPSGESLEGLEDRDFELPFEEVGPTSVEDYSEPCGGCTCCATGSHLLGVDFENKEAAYEIVEVQFKSNRAGFFINETGIYLQPNSRVVVEVERAIDLGVIAATGDVVHRKRRSQGIVGQPMGKVVRLANDEDLKELSDIRRIEEDAVLVFKKKCQKHNLKMKPITVEFQFDRSRITFYFKADKRIDFRTLVRDLASVYHTRIELKQIGTRDEAKKVGSIGVCGREICCSTWMTQFHKVNVDCAKYQSIYLNPSRLAGACGRFKCCLLFENHSYLEALEKFPPLNLQVVTPKGTSNVERVDIFKNRVFLRCQDTGIVESVGLDELKSYLVQNH